MALVEVTDQDFEDKVKKAERPVLVDFWAPWCGPCKMAAPVLEELSGEYSGKVDVVKVNVDENINTAQQYQILSIPTTILFKQGNEIGRQIGFAGKQPFEQLMKKGL